MLTNYMEVLNTITILLKKLMFLYL